MQEMEDGIIKKIHLNLKSVNLVIHQDFLFDNRNADVVKVKWEG